MARPIRRDADYFPFYVKDGKTLFILETKYGLQGIGFFTNLMRFLCKQPDHHICIKDESDRIYFFAQIRCEETVGMDMLELMAKTGKIDRDLWVINRVIVSEDLLESLKDAYKNRINPIIKIDQIRVTYQVNGVTPVTNSIESVDNPQTKLKETKLKETKVMGFDLFWKSYPKKTGKKKALKAWQSARDKPDLDKILSAIEEQKKTPQWTKDNGQYIPHPSTWLNEGRWDDETKPIAKPVFQRPSKLPSKSCTHCGSLVDETVRFREMDVCEVCLKKLDSHIDDKIKSITLNIKGIPDGKKTSHADTVREQAYKIKQMEET